MSYDQIAAEVDRPNEAFEKFYADMTEKIPALRGRGAVEIQPAKLKTLVKIAYLAGGFDAVSKILSSE